MAQCRHKGPIVPIKLKQLQYRSYRYTIDVYHFCHTNLSVRAFECSLTRSGHGFISRLESDDKTTSHNVSEGDETPRDCTEVAHLPCAFQNRGSALGFRIIAQNKIEWMCFHKPIEVLIDEAMDGFGRVLFDKVALLEKGCNGKRGVVQGHREHRDWFDALSTAWYPKTGLSIVWTDRERARREDTMRRLNEKQLGLECELEEDEEGENASMAMTWG